MSADKVMFKGVMCTQITNGTEREGLYGPGFQYGVTNPGHCGHGYALGECPMCWPVQPEVREEVGPGLDTVETHPAYGQISANRVSSTGYRLYGSDFDHQHFMTIRITESELYRGLSNDRPHSGKRLIEVALTESQWATFVSSPNSGDGVQCTLQQVGNRQISRIPEPTSSRVEQFSKELQETLGDALWKLNTLRERLESGKIGKEAIRLLDSVVMEIKDNTKYVTEQFDEHVEKTVEKGKQEINAYITQAHLRAGLEPPKRKELEG